MDGKVPRTAEPAAAGDDRPVLLSGGNPRMAKEGGDAPVQAYIAAMPGWTRDLGRRLDAPVVESVPGVRKAVRWTSPVYGAEGQGWLPSFHVLARYVKMTFFAGRFLEPLPPGGTARRGDACWIDVSEGEALDETQTRNWVRQAKARPGWIP